MIVITNISVPDYVYSYFLKLVENQPDKTPEAMIELYLKRHVKSKLGLEERKKRLKAAEAKKSH